MAEEESQTESGETTRGGEDEQDQDDEDRNDEDSPLGGEDATTLEGGTWSSGESGHVT